jgi:Xaa-Pro aminopeptidase
VNPRIDRLRESLEEPLLVTNPTNIHYLFGFKSSNAALLVERERARLFTDFRYSEAARAVEGVEFEETKRALLKDLADRLSGPIGFEADFVSYSGHETLRGGAIEPVPAVGSSNNCGPSRTTTSSRRSGEPARSRIGCSSA